MTISPRLAGLAAGLAFCVAGSASAQTLAPFGPSPASPAVHTGVFRAEALRGDAYSIEAGRLALARSHDPRTRRLAERSIANRQATSDALLPAGTSLTPGGIVVDDRALPLEAPLGLVTAPLSLVTAPLGGAGLTPIVDARGVEPGRDRARRIALDPARQTKLAALSAARGQDFDRLYTGQLAAANADTVQLYRAYARTGDSAAGRRFAAQALPVLEEARQDGARLQDGARRHAGARPHDGGLDADAAD